MGSKSINTSWNAIPSRRKIGVPNNKTPTPISDCITDNAKTIRWINVSELMGKAVTNSLTTNDLFEHNSVVRYSLLFQKLSYSALVKSVQSLLIENQLSCQSQGHL